MNTIRIFCLKCERLQLVVDHHQGTVLVRDFFNAMTEDILHHHQEKKTRQRRGETLNLVQLMRRYDSSLEFVRILWQSFVVISI